METILAKGPSEVNAADEQSRFKPYTMADLEKMDLSVQYIFRTRWLLAFRE